MIAQDQNKGPAFKDNKDRTWDATITVDVIKRVKRSGGPDLLKILDTESKLIEKLLVDPILLVDTIYLVIEPQAKERNIDDEDFGRSMAGDAIASATSALLYGLADFFPNPRDRKTITTALDATYRAMEKVRDHIEKMLDAGALDRIAEQALSKVGVGSTNSQESSD